MISINAILNISNETDKQTNEEIMLRLTQRRKSMIKMKAFQKAMKDKKVEIVSRIKNISWKQIFAIMVGIGIIVLALFFIIRRAMLSSSDESSDEMTLIVPVDITFLYMSTIHSRKPHQSWMRQMIPNEIVNCTIHTGNHDIVAKVLMTDNRSMEKQTDIDAFLFHGADLHSSVPGGKVLDIEMERKIFGRTKRENDTYIYQSKESNHIVDVATKSNVMNKFDLSMTFDFESDIFWPYLTDDVIQSLYQKEPQYNFTQKSDLTDGVMVAWIGSNCGAHNGRQIYLKELFGKIKVDSFGKCLNNKPFPAEYQKMGRDEGVTGIAAKYKFYLAVENSNCKDYITEKLQNAILATSIPIVFSVNNTPDYTKFLPKHSFINIADFESADDLAKYLNKIGSNETLYNEYFWYKQSDASTTKNHKIGFNGVMEGGLPEICEIANKVLAYKANKIKKKVKAEQPCLERNLMTQYISMM